MPSRVDPVDPDQLSDDDVATRLREATAVYDDAAYFGAIAHQPTHLDNLLTLFEEFPRSDALTNELLELVRLKVADTNQCAYCATVRTSSVDVVEAKETAVFGQIDEDQLTEREYLAVALAEQLSDNPHRITDEFIERLKHAFGEAGFIELLLFTSLEVGLDRFTIALELDTTEESPYPSGLSYPFDSGQDSDQ